MKSQKSQQGQVGIIVLLIMVVMVTVGVSVASRSVTELRLSRQEEASTRALDLAEGAAETIIADFETYSNNPDTQITIGGNEIGYSITAKESIEGMPVAQGHTLQVNLIGATANVMQVQWSGSGVCTVANPEASIVVAVLNSNGSLRRNFYGPNICSFRGDNAVGIGMSGGNYITPPSGPNAITILAGDQMARIKVLYNSANLTVDGSGLPSQVDVVRTTFTAEDGTTRAVEVNRLAGSLPSIFDYVLFSGDSLVK